MRGEHLRSNANQHKVKNLKSKNDDLNITLAMQKTKEYLEKRFSLKNGGGVFLIS
ncbi:hypothetical protein [Campylobacter cuniculorum]|uniref:hypothetical protein n=1 Tax=Campylobacter cuniculorum TaxID=374106 RepID=UPI0023F56EFF|nr:hypothetical protein [Campylobacter cuniculorum]